MRPRRIATASIIRAAADPTHRDAARGARLRADPGGGGEGDVGVGDADGVAGAGGVVVVDAGAEVLLVGAAGAAEAEAAELVDAVDAQDQGGVGEGGDFDAAAGRSVVGQAGGAADVDAGRCQSAGRAPDAEDSVAA